MTGTVAMTRRRRFSTPVLAALDAGKMLGIRAGVAPHRFLGVWMVVVDARLFVRSWNDKPTGWHRAFARDARGAIQIGARTIPVRARHARGASLMLAIDRAYAAKYPTPGSRKFVRGLRSPRRRRTTTELLPR
jgi:hypothetical protein